MCFVETYNIVLKTTYNILKYYYLKCVKSIKLCTIFFLIFVEILGKFSGSQLQQGSRRLNCYSQSSSMT